MRILISVCILSCLLSGCSTIAVHNPLKNSTANCIDLDWCVKSNSEMNVIDKSLSTQQNKVLFGKRINSALGDIESYFAENTQAKPRLQMTTSPNCISNTPSDMYLLITLSGYGSLKKKWKVWLIGSGIVEGIVQGLVVGGATHNPWLGLAVGAEEIGSEYLTWNGVDWILGDSFAPVTLEGELFYHQQTIWQDSFFVTENDDVLSKQDKKIKAKQLEASLHKAEHELLVSLNTYLQTEVNKTHTQ